MTLNARGLVKGQVGDFKGSVADLTAALMLDPKFAVAYENRWVALALLGQTDLAQKDWVESLKLSPNNQENLQAIKDKLLPIYERYRDPKTVIDFLTRGGAFYAARY